MTLLEYSTQDRVRDYECDLQGIVNNAVYMNYCEHARNQSIYSLGVTLESLHQHKEDPVLIKAEMNFKYSLRGGDSYRIETKVEDKGSFKLIFNQQIFNGQDILCLEGCFVVAVVFEGKPLPIKKTIFASLF